MYPEEKPINHCSKIARYPLPGTLSIYLTMSPIDTIHADSGWLAFALGGSYLIKTQAILLVLLLVTCSTILF